MLAVRARASRRSTNEKARRSMTTTTSSPDLGALERELVAAIGAARDLPQLEQLRVDALGKKGSISQQMARLGALAGGRTQGLRPSGQRNQGSA